MLLSQKYGKNLPVNYSLFGTALYGRNWSSEKYRFGFNGMEKDDEVKGAGNSVNFTYRMHDPRLGRFLSIDPLHESFPWNSPYTFSENSTVAFIELEGLERYYAANGDYLGKWGKSNQIRVVFDEKVITELKVSADGKGGFKPTGHSGRYEYYLKGMESKALSEVNDATATTVVRKVFEVHVKSEGLVNIERLRAHRVNEKDRYKKNVTLGSTSGNNIEVNMYEMGIDFYNLVSTLKHEKEHRRDIKGGISNNNYTHAKVYIKQFKDPSWQETTPDYKIRMRNVFLECVDGLQMSMTLPENRNVEAANKIFKQRDELIKQYEDLFNTKVERKQVKDYKENTRTHFYDSQLE